MNDPLDNGRLKLSVEQGWLKSTNHDFIKLTQVNYESSLIENFK